MTANAVLTEVRQPVARSVGPAWAFLACGGVAMALYVLVPASAMLVLFLIPAASIVAILLGARRNEAVSRRRPWYVLTAGLFGFYGGAILRLVVPGAMVTPPGPAGFVPDLLIVPGYLLVGYALRDMLRRRRGTADKLANADAVMAGLGAALGVWSLLIAPRIEAGHLSVERLAVAGFPIVDVLMLVLVMRLMVADGVRKPALWLLMVTMGVVLTVDLIYALYEGVGSPVLLAVFDLTSVLGYLAAGTAALHPTMRTLCDPQPVITRRPGASRLLGIAGVVLAPVVIMTVSPVVGWWDAWVRLALSGGFAVAIMSRILRSQVAQAHAEAETRHRLTHDALTELPNRELLTDTIAEWCEQAVALRQEISLLFLDLDRFKQVNEHWGHGIGDELLCAVASRLSAMVRSEDLVCRVGGDEFIIAMASPSHRRLALSMAERVVEEFRAPFTLSVGEVVVTPSIGVVRSSGAAAALELIRDADIAMYKAKESGGNTYTLFHPSLRDRAQAHIELEQALRGALGHGELSVAYQPIVTTDGVLTGFEALMRWTHPTFGVVSPDQFIPIAEKTGLIVPCGAWLLDEAMDQLARWNRDRPSDMPDLHVSINVSPRQLHESGLIDVVRTALARTGLPASSMWLEITESVLMKDLTTARALLEELRGLGVVLCIDDFGTGYASLSYVRELPTDITKIDKTFIDGIGKRSGDEAIVLAVIAMAHAVGQRIVAEGVETAAQAAWLAEHNCDLLQGWLFGQPRPAAAQDAWLHHTLPHLVPAA